MPKASIARQEIQMRVVICDDEERICELLYAKVKEQCPDCEIACVRSGEELLDLATEPDILFLDIQLPGENGMETARVFRRKNRRAVLIFVTALEEYVFQAFDVGAFHYLVKPFSDEKFAEVLKLAREALENQCQENKGGKPEHEKEASFLVKRGGTCRKVVWDNIVYAEVFNRKVLLHTLEEEIEYYGRLTDLEERAGEAFYRPHRAYLVNLRYVEKYDASHIWLTKGEVLMSKKQYAGFVRHYMRYVDKKRRG